MGQLILYFVVAFTVICLIDKASGRNPEPPEIEDKYKDGYNGIEEQ